MKLLVLLMSVTMPAAFAGLKLLSYNTWGMPIPIRPSHRGLKRQPFIIPKLKADIIAFQEVFSRNARRLSRMKEYPYHAYGPGRQRRQVLNSGLLIMSKYKILTKNTLLFNKCIGFDCLASKGAVHIRVNIPNMGFVNIYNTHLNAGKNRRVKNSQIKQLLDFISETQGDYPIFLLGDFNLTDRASGYTNITHDFAMFDSHKEYLMQLRDPSFEIKKSYTFKLKVLFYRYYKKIDFIFYKNFKNIKLKNHQVVLTGRRGGLPKLSDHYGLMLEVE